MADTKTTGTSTLFHIAGTGASLAFGFMVGTLFALKPVPDGLSFELNAPAVVAFLAGAVFAWLYWRMIARMALESAPAQRKKRFILFSVGLVLVGVISFLYPLKFIPAEKRKDVFIGLVLAAAVLSGVGLVMWKVRNFLEADLKKSESDQRPEE